MLILVLVCYMSLTQIKTWVYTLVCETTTFLVQDLNISGRYYGSFLDKVHSNYQMYIFISRVFHWEQFLLIPRVTRTFTYVGKFMVESNQLFPLLLLPSCMHITFIRKISCQQLLLFREKKAAPNPKFPDSFFPGNPMPVKQTLQHENQHLKFLLFKSQISPNLYQLEPS